MITILFALTVFGLLGFIIPASFNAGCTVEYIAKYPKANTFFFLNASCLSVDFLVLCFGISAVFKTARSLVNRLLSSSLFFF